MEDIERPTKIADHIRRWAVPACVWLDPWFAHRVNLPREWHLPKEACGRPWLVRQLDIPIVFHGEYLRMLNHAPWPMAAWTAASVALKYLTKGYPLGTKSLTAEEHDQASKRHARLNWKIRYREARETVAGQLGYRFPTGWNNYCKVEKAITGEIEDTPR